MSSVTDADVEELPTDYLEQEAEEEEQEEVEEEEPEIYYSEDFISGPFLSENCTIPGNILEFDYSFGYDCKKYYNLAVPDDHTIVFSSGNFINFFNVDTQKFTFRRSAFGGGIGHITTNPNPEYPHLAVAENGFNPPIIVYNWPSMEIVCVLKGGAERCFTHLNYRSDGLLLASQAGEPDFMITIFNWTKSKILLRTKSNVNEIYRVMFSPTVPNQLTTGGLNHIKFWKIASTFTGLKLQGELGRFGKTEYCDIIGVYPMPDEKTLSGCTWGNFLIWDEGLITKEVCRQKRQPLHTGVITQFFFIGGEIWTIGQDGGIRVWVYDAIDQADPPDDDRFVEVAPTYEFNFKGVMFMCICKQFNDPKIDYYFGQDGNGGLWFLDLHIAYIQLPPRQLYKCHAGAIMDIAACPWGIYLASLGIDGRLHIYQYVNKELLFIQQYPAKGRAMIWLPLKVQRSGNELILAFDDGNLRVVVLDINESNNTISATTIQITKPHSKPITKMSLNKIGNVLVTGGEDATIFIYKVSLGTNKYNFLTPIGYIAVPGIITYLTWHDKYDTVILVGCIYGDFVQVEVPTQPQPYTTTTYILKLNPQFQKFITYKAQIRRNIKVREIEARKAEKLVKKKADLERTRKENPGLEIDEEVFLADSESEEILEPLHIPEIPNRILWMQVTQEDTIWLSMAGFDAGYIYEYYIDQESEIPSNFQIIYNGDDIEINNYIYDSQRNYLIFAMEDGSIKVVNVNHEDWRDLSNYWQLSMHDNLNGFIPRMCFSYDEYYFFTCGLDGNIFSYIFSPENKGDVYPEKKENAPNIPLAIEDIGGYKKLSLEEAIVKAENDRIENLANENKKILREELSVLREKFQNQLVKNNLLKSTQIIPRELFNIDPRIKQDLEDRLNADLALVKRKLAFHVEKSKVGLEKLQARFIENVDLFPVTVDGIDTDLIVKIIRQRKLSDKFGDMLNLIELKIIEAELKNRYDLCSMNVLFMGFVA